MADGFILYQGPSRLDGAPIVVIATGFKVKSENAKTGAMIQTYILRSDVSPTDAVRTGADISICGQCPHRGHLDAVTAKNTGRTCYVNVGQGPLAVYKAFKRGAYEPLDSFVRFTGRKVRLGTYGDPAAVPLSSWKLATAKAAGWTGYTHQWRTRPDLQRYCMASVDNGPDALRAQAAGWRTFRVALPSAPKRLIVNEVVCPASAEAGKKLNCAQCMACGGGDRKSSIVIQAHGGFAVMANIKRRAAA